MSPRVSILLSLGESNHDNQPGPYRYMLGGLPAECQGAHHRTHSFREDKYWRNSMIHTGVLLLIDLVAGSLCEPKIRVYMHDLLKVIIVVIACFTRLKRIDMH